MPTVSSRMVVRVVQLASTYGVEGMNLARRSGIDPAALADPDARIDVDCSDAFIECVDAFAADPLIGAKLAETRDASTYDAAGLVLLASPTLRAGFSRAFRCQVLWGDGERFSIERDTVAFEPGRPHRRAHEIVTECALLEVLGAARTLAAPAASALRVTLRYDATSRGASLSELFGCLVAMRGERSSITLEGKHLDAEIERALVERLGVFATRGEASFAISVRAVASRALALGEASIVNTSRRMSVSPRTLQRRLAVERTTFERILDGAKRDLAFSLLGKRLAINEVAVLTGYSDKAAFYRAFRRWTGTTPAASLLTRPLS